jgi:chemotaxis protein histidine kinase CheA
MKVVVRSAVSEYELNALPKTSIREIFELMCKNLLIFEKWYFGLMYRGADYEQFWVDVSKKSLKDFRTVAEKFEFKVKYYPEDVGEELIENSTTELFFTQVKNDIVKDEIYCPADTCALLASYALQAKYGDYNSREVWSNQIKKLIPERVINQHKMEVSEWEESIILMWQKHKGLEQEDAMMEYLKLAQNLEMYGVTFFKIRNRKGSELLLGVTALGIDIYKTEDRLNPQISFPWAEIKNLKFKDRKFVIKPTDKAATDFIFLTSDPKMSKLILNLGIGNHALYVRRRKPESTEIMRMKERAKEMRKHREDQKKRLNDERSAREAVEKQATEYKTRIEAMKEEMERQQASLKEAQETIQKLQQQLEELQKAKEELEKQQQELREMMERLEHSKNMEAAEKQALEDEILAKQLEVQRIQDEVNAKDEETRRLQEQVEEAQRREEELRRQEEERKQRELEEAARKNAEEEELEAVPEGADTALPELADVNDQLREQLKLLQSKLDETRNQTMDTDLDKIHRVNLAEGRNKYKTLAEIRRGNTVRRVEMFENL